MLCYFTMIIQQFIIHKKYSNIKINSFILPISDFGYCSSCPPCNQGAYVTCQLSWLFGNVLWLHMQPSVVLSFSFSLPRLKGSRLLQSSVEHRLRMLIPYLSKWPQAMALKGFPSNIPSSVETLALMVDDMWYWAGDRSADFSWYTKRALLTAVYTATGIISVCIV